MAKGKTSRPRGRQYRKRRGPRKSNRDGGKVALLRNTLVPDRTILKMSYKDDINLSAASPSSYAVSNFRLNSIYDPDYANINGHQPLGYDQWANFYAKYRVYKATVKATFINNSPGGVRCAIIPYNNSPIGALDDASFEQPHTVTRIVAGSSGMNKVIVKKTIDLPRILGQSHLQYKSSEDTSALFGYNPAELVSCCVGVQALNNSFSPTVQTIVEITFHLELFDRITQTISYPAGKDPDYGRNPSYDGSQIVT